MPDFNGLEGTSKRTSQPRFQDIQIPLCAQFISFLETAMDVLTNPLGDNAQHV